MSGFDKIQNYDVYDYHQATRPQAGQDYAGFAAHQTYTGDYRATQAQVPSGLPQSAATFNAIPPPQQYGTHDPTYYAHQNVQNVQYPAYVDPTPRPLPEIISFTPIQGQQGTKVTVYFRSPYDFDNPQVTPVIMFGQTRCQTMLTKTTQPGGPNNQYQYALSADAPPLTPTSTPSPHISLSLAFENSPVNWESPTLDFGNFTYLDPSFYAESPQIAQRKRKLSPQASPRRSPGKKPSLHALSTSAAGPSSPFRRPSLPDTYAHGRRVSGPERAQYNTGQQLGPAQPRHYYGATPSLQTGHSPSWGSLHQTTRSPSSSAMATAPQASILPSPSSQHNPALIRTSTLQTSPVTPHSAPPQGFNPYVLYPSNTKAILKLDGELEAMPRNWTSAEREVQRRLVQFRRSQTGSVITASFEPVTLENRMPNSICVSCIWWAEKNECYVTSVDTISLLESLVGVRFTVEEKNRIRRNLEGFRPATVSKTKAESEEFFKLIMGFPNPKPRNIEKDVKVFPWRILTTALKKIIGKYSASYASTAGTLPNPSAAGTGYTTAQVPDARVEQTYQQRQHASPRSTSSSAASHGHAYATAMPTNPGTYPANTMGSAGLGFGPSAGPPDLRLAAPVTTAPTQTTSWHQPSAHYSNDLSRGSWDFPAHYMTASPATGMPGSTQPYQYQYQRVPAEPRMAPLHNYDDQSHQTSHA